MSNLEFDETFDFVVVGSGGGSMCAALFMLSLGKSVVILEKTDLVGGTTARSGGVMWIPNNRFMKEDGVEDSYDKAMQYLEATAGSSPDAPGTTPERRSAYVTEGPRMIDFLVGQGIKLLRPKSWPDYHDYSPGSSVPGRTVIAELFDANQLGEWKKKLRPGFLPVPAYHSEGFEIATFKSSLKGKLIMLKVGLRSAAAKLTGKDLYTAGAALQGRMLQAALKAGCDIRANHAVRSFVMEDGAVKGVVVETGGKQRRIGARSGVLVNAGGFSQNQAMRDTYMPGTSARWTGTTPGDTGEMIETMMEMGAATGQMNEMVGNQFSIPPGRDNHDGTGLSLGAVSGQMNFSKPHSIIVDKSGQRYLNESCSYMEFCQKMLKRHQTVPAVPSWWIVDEQYMRRYMWGGTMPGSKKPQEWYDSGYLKRADTIEELAGMIGVDPATLKTTVDRFNAGARNGVDEDFGRGGYEYSKWLGDKYVRPSPTLGTIEQGPFYAAQAVPGDVGTYGGVVTDANARVLRGDGSVIEGLYATGISTASVMGRFYPGAGSSVGPSFVFGYIAAKHAANAGNMA
jgi:3-oxosteroid 1-dehydrogenase